ncbi:MAG: DinB family protein [Thermomicrobiales bacterium]|nr:DinB family protein [Thermomicrobiales bacterium]
MELVVAEIVRDFKDVHAQMRSVVRELNPARLSWQPAPNTNSIAVLVVHTLGSEAEVLRIVSRTPTDRDRDAEFRAEDVDTAHLLRLLDAADALLDDLGPKITPSDLVEPRPRRDNPPQSGLHWLMTNYGHAREHLGQLLLTAQLAVERAQD